MHPHRHRCPDTAALLSAPVPARTRLTRAALMAGLAASALTLPPAAHAQASARTTAMRHEIAAGTLDQTLNRFAAAAGITLSIDGALTAGKTSPGLSGSFGVRDGLAALLAGTGLQAVATPAGAYVLRAAAMPPTRNDATLQTVTVTARAETPGELPLAYAGGQVARGARMGLLGNQDLMDTPFNSASYTSELMQNQQSATLSDVLDNDPAVRMSSRGRNTSVGGGDNFFLRGFSLGNRDISFNGLYGVLPYGTLSLETVERVEVLKGPSALLSGMAPSGGVGGAINVVPKRATDTPITRLTASLASDSVWGTHLDVGRRFGEQNQFGVRVNGVYRSGDTATSRQSVNLGTASVGLDFLGERLRASVDLGYQSDDARAAAVGYRLAPALTAVPGAPKTGSRFAQDWERRKYVDDHQVVQAEYDLTSALMLYGAAGVRDHRHSNYRTESRILNPGGGLSTSPVHYPETSKSKSALVGARVKFDALNARHELNVSASSLHTTAGYGYAQWAGVASSLYHPAMVADPIQTGAPFAGFLDVRKASGTRLSSLGVSDSLSWNGGAIQLILGLRHQKVAVDNYAATAPVNPRTSGYESSVNSPAVALVVKPWAHTSIYANYIEGLSTGTTAPVDAENRGEVFPPVKTKQKELGAKVDFGHVIGTVSLFEIEQPNAITVPGSAPTTYRYAMDGEQRNRGVEFSAFGEPARGLRLLGGVTYLQAKQVRTQGGLNDGKDGLVAPRWMANASLEWDAPFAAGLTFTTRVLATGAQYVNTANTLRLPGWARWDIGARYQTRALGHPVTLRAQMLNVADRSYWEGSAGSGGIVLSAPRTFNLSATIDF